MNKKKIWNLVKLFLKLAVTSLALYLVFKKVDPRDIREAFFRTSPGYFIAAFVFFVLSQCISSSRLNSFFKSAGLQLSERYNFKIYLLGMFYNLFLPGGIGGDGYKIFFLRRKFQISGKKLFSAIFFDRLSGFWALGMLTAALIIFIPQLGVPQWIPAASAVAATAVYYLFMRRFFNSLSQQFVIKHIKAVLVQSMQLISVIFLLYAFQFNGKFSPYLLMFLLSSLVAVFPFTVGGLGAREVVFLWGAEFFHLDQHIAVIISLLFYCISALMSFSGIYFVFNPKKLGEDKLPPLPDALDEEEEGVAAL